MVFVWWNSLTNFSGFAASVGVGNGPWTSKSKWEANKAETVRRWGRFRTGRSRDTRVRFTRTPRPTAGWFPAPLSFAFLFCSIIFFYRIFLNLISNICLLYFKEELIDDGVVLSKRKSKVKASEDVDLKDQHLVENSGDGIIPSTEEIPDKMDEAMEESSENISLQESEVPNKLKRVLHFFF